MEITHCLFLLVWEPGLSSRESWPGGLDADVASPLATGGGQRLSPGPGAHKVTSSPLRLPSPPFPDSSKPTPASGPLHWPVLLPGHFCCPQMSRRLASSFLPALVEMAVLRGGLSKAPLTS